MNNATIYHIDQTQISSLEYGASVDNIVAASSAATRFELGNAWQAYDAVVGFEYYRWLAPQQSMLFNAQDFDQMFDDFGRRLITFRFMCEIAKYPKIADRDYASYWQQHHSELAHLIEHSFFFMQDLWREPMGVVIVLR